MVESKHCHSIYFMVFIDDANMTTLWWLAPFCCRRDFFLKVHPRHLYYPILCQSCHHITVSTFQSAFLTTVNGTSSTNNQHPCFIQIMWTCTMLLFLQSGCVSQYSLWMYMSTADDIICLSIIYYFTLRTLCHCCGNMGEKLNVFNVCVYVKEGWRYRGMNANVSHLSGSRSL